MRTLLLLLVLLVGCFEGEPQKYEGRKSFDPYHDGVVGVKREEGKVVEKYYDAEHFEYNGHKYIKFGGTRVGFVHDPDCPCERLAPGLTLEEK